MIAWLLTVLFWGGFCGFDWVFDSIDCYKYDAIAQQSEYFLENGMSFVSYDTWRVSVVQNYEFNRQVFIAGGPLEDLSEDTYENIRYMVRTYQQEKGMISFFQVY